MDRKALRYQLEDRIKQMEVSSKQPEYEADNPSQKGRGGFLTWTDLEEVLTDESLRIQLHQDFPCMSEDTISKLIRLIQKRCPKLYAILLLIKESKIIKEMILENDIGDDIFKVVMNDDEIIELSYCTEEKLLNYPCFKRIANEFYKKQWVIPPVLSENAVQDFPPEHFIFPFIESGRRIGRGGNGTVYKMKIAQDFLRGDHDQQSQNVVYKQVKKHSTRDWDKVLREVHTLRARQHDNIIPLLSSFRTGREFRSNESDTEIYLFMIQPQAVESMDKWMESNQDYLQVKKVRESHIRDIMFDLVAAVTYIHGTIGEHVVFHHDLKPSNILRFNRDGNLPIWKICDFGSSNAKLAQGITGTDNMMVSYVYSPPEFWPKEPNKDLGRAWDVFSLGCIFLELATLYKYGWNQEEGLPKFTRERMNNLTCPHSVIQTQIPMHEDYSFFNNMVAVKAWIKRLEEGSSNQFIKILHLIEEMLNEQRLERIFAFEVQIYLCETYDDMDMSKKEELYETICQSPNKSQNGLDRRNNPLRRARSQRWALDPKLVVKILENKGWNDATPESTEEVETRPRTVLDDVVTTLPGSTHWRPDSAGDEIEAENLTAFPTTKLYGRTELDEKLRKSFSSGAKRVALYGLWGMGKSHLAYQYAKRLHDPHDDHRDSKKHTFWVSARDLSAFLEDYKRIAQAVGLLLNRDPTALAKEVKAWLSEKPGTWLLVVDSLDLSEVLQSIREFLPMRDSGQVLFTTRNRLVFQGNKILSKEHCHHVDQPDFKTSWSIFKLHFGDRSLKDRNSHYKTILERLGSPLLIILAAQHMAGSGMLNSKKMLEKLDTNIVDTIKDFHGLFKSNERQAPQFMERLIRPLLDPEPDSKWCGELRLLCCLACFDTQELEFDIIKWYNEQRGSMDDYIAQLKACSFLKEERDESDEGMRVFKMPELVRESALAWVRKQIGERGVWHRYQKMLTTLGKRYDETSKAYRRSLDDMDWSYVPKLPLRRHFESFRKYVKSPEGRALKDLELKDENIRYIVTFSHIYSAEGKHEEAIDVLMFAEKFYKKGKHRYTLVRELLMAQVSRQHDRLINHLPGWDAPERICQQLLKQYQNDENEWRDIKLDLATIYRLKEKWDDAWDQLHDLKHIHIQVNDQGRPMSPVICRTRGTIMDEKNFIARLERARGQLHLAIGCCRTTRRSIAYEELEKAQLRLRAAKKAAMNWFPHRRTWIIDTDDMIAKATLENGTSCELAEVEEMLEKNLKEMKCRTSIRRQAETQLLLAKIRIKREENRVFEIVEELDILYHSLQKDYGGKDRATSECHSLLERTRLRAREYKRARRWKMCMVFLVISLVLFILCRGGFMLIGNP